MMRLSFTHALLVLFLLIPGEAQGVASQRSGSGNRRDDVTVSLLVCTLLLLLILLFLAWRHLNRKSEGQYHPQRLMRTLVLRWQEFRGKTESEELSHDYLDERQGDEELGEQQHDDLEKEDCKESLLQQGGNEHEEDREERSDKSATTEPPEKRVEQELEREPLEKKEEEQKEDDEEDRASRATEGRAETLLSDLHSFSGTAAWEDSSKNTHVTAL